MNNEPRVTDYFDEEEKDLIESIEEAVERDDYVPQSFLTDARRQELRQMAHNTLNEKTTQVTLRIPRTDLVRLKAQAAREGIPYQTWIKSVLHKSVTQ